MNICTTRSELVIESLGNSITVISEPFSVGTLNRTPFLYENSDESITAQSLQP